MKHYKIKRKAQQELEDIKFGDFYISPNLDYISGTTSSYYNFSSNEEVYVSTSFTQGLPTKATMASKNVLKQGYCVYNYPYEILTDNDIEYIIYNNGKPYYKQDNGKFLVNGNEYSQENNLVKIPTTYYVYNNEITIGNVTYSIDIDERSDTFNYILTLVNNDIVTINFYTKEETIHINNEETITKTVLNSELVTLFTITKNSDKNIEIDTITCCEDIGYIFYCDKKYYLEKNNNKIGVLINDNWYYPPTDVENISAIDINGDIVSIQYETVSTANGDILLLYLKNPEVLNTEIPLLCKALQPINSHYFIHEGNYIIYNGEKYNIQHNIIHKIKSSDDKYYQLFYNDDNTYAYITVNGNDIFFKIKNDNTVVKDTMTDEGYVEKEYEIQKFDGVIVNGVKYEVIKNNILYDNGTKIIEQNYVSIFEKPNYFLKIVDFKNNFLVKCCVDFDKNNLTDDEYQSEITNISNTICSNKDLFTFSSPNTPFGYKFILDKEKKDYVNDGSQYDDVPIDIEETLHIYKIHNYITIPMPLFNDGAININQQQVVSDYFFKKEIDNAVTNIIDMEKNLYYPVYKTNNNQFQNLPLINEIIFNLHFRTRDLDTWKIIEDDNDLGSGETVLSKDCNWFITDYYKDTLDFPTLEDKANASDLLGFLDFTNDDVFYQKSKISKSFLRLTFYDSPDPKRQSLLHSATVFMNEGNLYNKFINNVKNGEFLTIIKNDESISRANNLGIATSVSVDTEVSDGGHVKLDENKRLSSQFLIKSRYEEETSSEGFYLYMFKNLSDNLHEKSIYMKVEFNHAGVGRTIPFILPLSEDGITPMSMNTEEDWNILKKGVKLKDLYKNMFIELKVVYDAINNRYVYYRPQTSDNNKMIFNLFELKIANEN